MCGEFVWVALKGGSEKGRRRRGEGKEIRKDTVLRGGTREPQKVAQYRRERERERGEGRRRRRRRR
jgi:hypothetical protein